MLNLQQAGAWLLLMGATLSTVETGMAALNARKPKAPDDLG